MAVERPNGVQSNNTEWIFPPFETGFYFNPILEGGFACVDFPLYLLAQDLLIADSKMKNSVMLSLHRAWQKLNAAITELPAGSSHYRYVKMVTPDPPVASDSVTSPIGPETITAEVGQIMQGGKWTGLDWRDSGYEKIEYKKSERAYAEYIADTAHKQVQSALFQSGDFAALSALEQEIKQKGYDILLGGLETFKS